MKVQHWGNEVYLPIYVRDALIALVVAAQYGKKYSLIKEDAKTVGEWMRKIPAAKLQGETTVEPA